MESGGLSYTSPSRLLSDVECGVCTGKELGQSSKPSC